MSPQGIQALVSLSTLIAIKLLPVQPLSLVLELLQRGIALRLVPLQAVHPSISSSASVAAKLLMTLGVPLHDGLRRTQQRRVAQQVVHRQLSLEGDLANLLVLILLSAALRVLACKDASLR